MSNNSKTPTPVSYKILLVLCLCFFNEAFTFSNLFSYIGFMVWDFNLTDDVDQVGYYAGYLGSCFSLASFISSFWWGKMSDKYGKRPVLLIGATGATLTCLVFGFSSSLWMAMGVRFASGLLNGNIGVVKGYTTEITDSSNQAKTMSYMQLSWGLGNILGAVLGGVMARPCQQHPTMCDPASFLGRHPYALPNLINTAFSLGGLILLYVFIPRQSSSTYQVMENEEEVITVSDGEDEVIGDGQDESILKVELHPLSHNTITNNKLTEAEQGEGAIISSVLLDQENSSSLSSSSDSLLLSSSSDSLLPLSSSSSSSSTKTTSSSSSSFWWRLQHMFPCCNSARTKEAPQQESFWKFTSAMVLVAAYGALGASYTVFEEAWPLWALSPTSRGGLSFTPSELGYVGAINGVVAILIQLTIFLPIVKKLGFLRVFQLGAALGVISFLPVPLLSYFATNVPLLWSGLSGLIVLRVLAGQCAFTACFGLLSNSIPAYHVGSVHGFAQSGVALTRAVSPAIAGTLLAWGYSNGLGFPFNQNLVFVVAAVLSVVAGLLTIRLPRSLDVPYAESHPTSSTDMEVVVVEGDKKTAVTESSQHEKKDASSTMMMAHA